MTPPTDATRPALSDSDQAAATPSDVLLQKMQLTTGHAAVVGLQWGDEGKGKVVDLLAPGFDYVVRYNGGANAGHSVQVGDERYALHLIPSGILYGEKVNVLGNGVVVDPAQLAEEIEMLRKRGIEVKDNLRVSDRAHVVMPWHTVEDTLFDKAVAQAWEMGSAIGTTGRGIGPCYADKALRSTAIRVGELLNEDRLRQKVMRTAAIKNVILEALSRQCGQAFEPFKPEELFEQARGYAETLRPYVCDTAQLLHGAIDDSKRLLFEGANATLLDIDHGTYPYVTSSNCSSLGVHTGTGVPGHRVGNVLGIVKAYQTRVGGGPMPTELDNDVGERIRDRGNEYGTTTGRPRRCGWLDLVALKYTATVSGATGIALMLLDVLAGLEELKVCTAYRYRGEPLAGFPADADVLSEVEPVYETLPGFSEDIAECRRLEDLPASAQAYIQRIEQHVQTPVVMASVGPRRDQTVFR